MTTPQGMLADEIEKAWDAAEAPYRRALVAAEVALRSASPAGNGGREALRAALKEHWLTQVKCDHEAHTDTPVCYCCEFICEPQPTLGAAVDAWISHVIAQLPQGAPDKPWSMAQALTDEDAARVNALLTTAVAPDGARAGEAAIACIRRLAKCNIDNPGQREMAGDDILSTLQKIEALALPAVVGIEGRDSQVRNLQGAVHLLRKAIHAGDPIIELDLRCHDIWTDLEKLCARHPHQPVEDKR